MNPQKLFVYGTLMPGAPNAHILERIGGSLETATVSGSLKAGGWGAAQGYPAFCPNSNSCIPGWVFAPAEPERCWRILDDFEGSDYRRIPVSAEFADGRCETVWIYAAA